MTLRTLPSFTVCLLVTLFAGSAAATNAVNRAVVIVGLDSDSPRSVVVDANSLKGFDIEAKCVGGKPADIDENLGELECLTPKSPTRWPDTAGDAVSVYAVNRGAPPKVERIDRCYGHATLTVIGGRSAVQN